MRACVNMCSCTFDTCVWAAAKLEICIVGCGCLGLSDIHTEQFHSRPGVNPEKESSPFLPEISLVIGPRGRLGMPAPREFPLLFFFFVKSLCT